MRPASARPTPRGLAARFAALGLAACGGPDPAVEQPDAGCPSDEPVVEVWRHPTSHFGLPEGSAALCDLDRDGELELIAPIAPAPPSRATLAVLDAATGAPRWEVTVERGNYGTPLCVDVDGDGTDDVLTSGRTADVTAHDGATGDVLWTLSAGDADFLARGNTYSPVASGVTDLLFVTQGGGGGPAEDGNTYPDVPGRLLVFDRDGVVRATWTEPTNAEIYATPAVLRGPDGALLVAVGSGGERLGGTVHLLALDENTLAFTVRAVVDSTCATGGFVASPTVGDVDADGLPELVVVDFCGAVQVVGLDGTPHWTRTATVPYGTANPLLADLDGDGPFDVVAVFESLNFSFREQTWGDPRSVVAAFDGPTGAPRWTYETARWAFASPTSADLDGDGLEDVLVLAAAAAEDAAPELVALGGLDGAVLWRIPHGQTAGTPVLGDADADGHLDLWFADAEPGNTAPYAVNLEVCGRAYEEVTSWSGFRGAQHDGVRP